MSGFGPAASSVIRPRSQRGSRGRPPANVVRLALQRHRRSTPRSSPPQAAQPAERERGVHRHPPARTARHPRPGRRRTWCAWRCIGAGGITRCLSPRLSEYALRRAAASTVVRPHPQHGSHAVGVARLGELRGARRAQLGAAEFRRPDTQRSSGRHSAASSPSRAIVPKGRSSVIRPNAQARLRRPRRKQRSGGRRSAGTCAPGAVRFAEPSPPHPASSAPRAVLLPRLAGVDRGASGANSRRAARARGPGARGIKQRSSSIPIRLCRLPPLLSKGRRIHRHPPHAHRSSRGQPPANEVAAPQRAAFRSAFAPAARIALEGRRVPTSSSRTRSRPPRPAPAADAFRSAFAQAARSVEGPPRPPSSARTRSAASGPAAGERGAAPAARRGSAAPACPTRLAKNPAASLAPVGQRRRAAREPAASSVIRLHAQRGCRPAASAVRFASLSPPTDTARQREQLGSRRPRRATRARRSAHAGQATQRRATFRGACRPNCAIALKGRRIQDYPLTAPAAGRRRMSRAWRCCGIGFQRRAARTCGPA